MRCQIPILFDESAKGNSTLVETQLIASLHAQISN